MKDDLVTTIEALLFYKASPLSVADLAKATKATPAAVEAALATLAENLSGRGITLMRTDTRVLLSTAPSVAHVIEAFAKEELSRDLGKAGLETLTIVLYRHPVTRSEIDFIRGVNSTYILRALTLRGLIERIANPTDERSYRYQPTFMFLQHLGIARVTDLPDYEKIRAEFDTFLLRDNKESANESLTE